MVVWIGLWGGVRVAVCRPRRAERWFRTPQLVASGQGTIFMYVHLSTSSRGTDVRISSRFRTSALRYNTVPSSLSPPTTSTLPQPSASPSPPRSVLPFVPSSRRHRWLLPPSQQRQWQEDP